MQQHIPNYPSTELKEISIIHFLQRPLKPHFLPQTMAPLLPGMLSGCLGLVVRCNDFREGYFYPVPEVQGSCLPSSCGSSGLFLSRKIFYSPCHPRHPFINRDKLIFQGFRSTQEPGEERALKLSQSSALPSSLISQNPSQFPHFQGIKYFVMLLLLPGAPRG